MIGKHAVKENRHSKWIFHLYYITIASAFVRHQHPYTSTTTTIQRMNQYYSVETTRIAVKCFSRAEDDLNVDVDKTFDEILKEPSNFGKAVQFFQANPEIDLSRERFERIFVAIEERTSDAESTVVGGEQGDQNESSMIAQSRKEMTDIYSLMKEREFLPLFGSITKENIPAAGSHTVRPTMLEKITSLSMSSLTPKPSNTLLYAGIGVAILESLASGMLGWDLNVLFFISLSAALCDQLVLNGALSESVVKVISRETQQKITRHEAGHFLCSYILGCPVEGYVLSAWGALKDPRFRGRGVSAGTSFFDPSLSSQIENSKITRSSIDRYSIIVMAGIAAEAISYGRADGGAGDEQALIAFLSNLNGDPSSSVPAWNDITIRNQARWGALQSVLIIKEYKECYDALVDAMERGGSLGDCIYAIENTGREKNKRPLRRPMGYISEKGEEEIWTTTFSHDETMETEIKQESADIDQSLETLREYKEKLANKLIYIDEKLEDLRNDKV